jgi:hypothetical protein
LIAECKDQHNHRSSQLLLTEEINVERQSKKAAVKVSLCLDTIFSRGHLIRFTAAALSRGQFTDPVAVCNAER